ncbi:MAG: type I-C CRISPR-associated protein Cas8c/Csd1 [Alphaproteobacteria bacterium PA2]|nr:MAG: type I-C CRISPR-associated protein Cas8c/Csd1 [Alphaproteobacteria bacterium PA2]
MSVLAALAEHHDRLRQQGQAPPVGFATVRLGYALVLDRKGRLLGAETLMQETRKGLQPGSCLAPKAPQRVSGIVSGFLWDKSSYVLGVWDVPEGLTAKKSPARVAREHAAFVDLHLRTLAETQDPGLRALHSFLESWSAADHGDRDLLSRVSGHNLCFRLSGAAGYLHETPAALELARFRALADGDLQTGQCMVTGTTGPLARLHPRIAGLPGSNTTGASLVSHATPALRSHGALLGENAPVLASRAAAYGEALNILLARRAPEDQGGAPQNRIAIGADTLVFWGESREAETVMRWALGVAGHDMQGAPEGQGKDLSDEEVWLALVSPNGGRLAVRRAFNMTLGLLLSRLEAFLEASRLSGPCSGRLDLQRLCRGLSPQSAAGASPDRWAAELCASILDGRAPGAGLLRHTVMLISRDQGVSTLRAGLMKACLLGTGPGGAGEAFGRDWPRFCRRPAFDLGRIYACLAALQAWEQGLFSARRDHDLLSLASACPAQVLRPGLLRMDRSLRAVTYSGRTGRPIRIVRALDRLLENIGGRSALAPTLGLTDRALFLIGFHHQRQELKTPVRGADPAPEKAGGS